MQLVGNEFQMPEPVNFRKGKPYYVILIMVSMEFRKRQKRIVSIADRKSWIVDDGQCKRFSETRVENLQNWKRNYSPSLETIKINSEAGKALNWVEIETQPEDVKRRCMKSRKRREEKRKQEWIYCSSAIVVNVFTKPLWRLSRTPVLTAIP